MSVKSCGRNYQEKITSFTAEGLEVVKEDEGGGGGLAPKRRRTVLPPSRQVCVLPALPQRGMKTEDTIEV